MELNETQMLILAQIEAFQIQFRDIDKEDDDVKFLKESGLIMESNNRYYITSKGMDVFNSNFSAGVAVDATKYKR